MNNIKFKPNLKKINRLKKQYNVTNRNIAREHGVSEVWVSYVIHGKGESRPLKLVLAKALRVPVQEIFPERKAA
jgi:lambda repressor-like predicted transcriptional regulator